MEVEYERGSKEAESFSNDLIRQWQDIMEPETDYGSDDQRLTDSDSEVSTCTSDSSFLTDSSDFSESEAEEGIAGQSTEQPHRKKAKKKTKVLWTFIFTYHYDLSFLRIQCIMQIKFIIYFMLFQGKSRPRRRRLFQITRPYESNLLSCAGYARKSNNSRATLRHEISR